MKTLEEELGVVVQHIRTIRKSQAISQAELATRADLSDNYIACIETGRKQPSVLTILKIARALQVPAGVFFDAEMAEQAAVEANPAANSALQKKKRRTKEKIIKLLDAL
ncbi:MAG: helix-turn-helix domain-containing protein [Spirochaetaceae bacterium]|jgi:transcriptional regulator with XRE-family HTH domain|nr:helix-turn-helix domain-containing protein [Spirochaetaceae bacterium]